MSDAPAPIALFAYNRPRHLAQTVAALLRDSLAVASDLHVFCDGPKTPAAEAAVREVRAFVRSITGFRSISIVEQERNIGLANSIIAGVTALCDRFGRVVVVEDDLVVAPCFLRFMNTGLERYEGDEQVMQIAGYMFPIDARFRTKAFFLPVPTSWGWATWQRAWQHFDQLMTQYAALQRSPQLRRQFDLDGAYDYFDLLERQMRGAIDSWAIRWHLSCFMRQGLTLFPGTTLVQNMGADGSGTHAVVEQFTRQSASLPDAKHTFSFPDELAIDRIGYAHVKCVLRKMRAPKGLIGRMPKGLIGRIKSRWL